MMAEEKPVKAIVSWSLEGDQELLLHENDCALLGRDDSNDAVFNVGYVSRKHAIIAWREDGFTIQDLGSTNGTEVNGQRVVQPVTLKDGDTILMDQLALTFRLIKEAVPEKKPNVTTLVVAANSDQPNLLISSGPGEGRKIVLRHGTMSIGRATAHSENWDIALQDRSVSRPHAQIEHKGLVYLLSDLGSANGTLLNGKPLAEPAVLQEGDVIVIGETTLIFRLR
jgi:pSer/pThr/pTyr-binding forkhead associated (FHA) protein